jgi:hypothetical protein
VPDHHRTEDIQAARRTISGALRRLRSLVEPLHEARVLIGDHAPDSSAKFSAVIFGVEGLVAQLDALETECVGLLTQ